MKRTGSYLILALAAVAILLVGSVGLRAQDDNTITITGTLDAITANNTIIVNGASYNMGQGVALPSSTLLGVNITITGRRDPATQAVVVISITITTGATPTPSATAEGTAEATPESTAESTAESTPEATPESTAQPTPEMTPSDDDTLEITIIIEGPVQEININIITIYDIDIELRVDDPLLVVIQIGDIVRVEGNAQDRGGVVIIIAVNVAVINVDINIATGEIWRDDNATCANPPPDWAPANGWRRRCESNNGGGSITITIGGGGDSGGSDDDGMGMGMGMGMGDDD